MGKKVNSLTDTYTDDVFGALTSDKEIEERKNEMGNVWEIKDVGESEYFLGTRIQQDLTVGTIRLTQRPYSILITSHYETPLSQSDSP